MKCIQENELLKNLDMTKTVKLLLSSLKDLNIKLSLKDDNIEILSYDKKIPSHLVQEIKSNKSDIIDYLSKVEKTTEIPLADKADSYPLSPSQKKLWILSQFKDTANVYNLTGYNLLETNLNIENFRKAVDAVIERHEILRTIFKEDSSGEVRQWILTAKKLEFTIDYIDLRKDDRGEETLKEYVDKDKYIPFDLSQGPLFRICLFQFSDDKFGLYYCMHHIISDDWSMIILTKDISEFYNTFQDSLSSNLSNLRIQFKDYATWQNAELETKGFDEHKTYWLEKLSGEIPFLDLPTQKPRPKLMTYNGRKLKMLIEPEITQELKDFCKEQEGSLFMAVLAVFNVLLYRYTYQDDIIIGTPSVDRGFKELENQIGFYVNTVVLRNKLDPKKNFLQFYESIKESVISDFKHQKYPFDKLLEELESKRDVSRSPLFDVVITMLNSQDNQEGNLEEETFEIEDLGKTQSKFDLDMYVAEINDCLQIEMIYNEDVYDIEIIQKFLRHFKQLLTELVHNPKEELAKVCFLDSIEKEKLLFEFNSTEIDYPKDSTIIDVFEEYTINHPNDTAIIEKEKEYSYHELNLLAEKYSDYLNKLENVKNSDKVLVTLDHDYQMIATLLAVKKLGAVCVTVDPKTPEKRIDFYFNDSYSVLKIDKTVLSKMNAYNGSIEKTSYKKDRENDIEAIIYTSGTTGIPKGVLIKSSSVLNRLSWMWEKYPFEKNEICCAKTSLSFVDHIWEFFGPLLKGIPLVFYKKEDIIDVPEFIEKLHNDKISRIVLVPSLLRAILTYSDLCTEKLKNLNLWISSGEALKKSDVENFYTTMQREDVRLLNIYGSTEVTADATYYDTYDDYNRFKKFHLFEDSIKDEIEDLINIQTTSNEIVSTTISDLLKDEQFKDVEFNLKRTKQQYLEFLKSDVLPNSINVGSPLFIGHMTGPVPSIIRELNSLIIALNQNQVKIETSMVATLIEKQVIGFFHKLIYKRSSVFYEEYTQSGDNAIGIITNGGTISNITALSYSLNSLLGPKDNFSGIKAEGLISALDAYGYKKVALLGSKMCHYSFDKALKLLGLGSNSFVELDLERKTDDTIRKEVSSKIEELKKQGTLVIGIVGIAGTTESGNIDPLTVLGEIAREYKIYYHVDAAFGGSFLMSRELKKKFVGIELADSVSICAHKQLYLPIGLSICVFKNENHVLSSENNTAYQARKGSNDLGKYTIEGSRGFNSLILHATLSIFGQEGFEQIIDHNYTTAQSFANLIRESREFELFEEPDLNIIQYRYVPVHFRDKTNFSDEELLVINEINQKIQQEQFKNGKSFVSYTRIKKKENLEKNLVLRTVFMNPYTTIKDLEIILEEQIDIASNIDEVSDSKTNSSRNPNVLIGRPIGNVKVYILDEFLNVLPIGVAGEICISGDCVSPGYLNLAADLKFVENPFQNGGKLFKTGDLGKRLEDGNIAYIGRKDDQVKIRGHRVELGEIEHCLKSKKDISKAVVLANKTEQGTEEIFAYFVSDINQNINDLQDFLSSQLPDYMLPSKYIQLDEIPLTVNGKIDKKKLSNSSEEVLSSGIEYVEPSTTKERELILELEPILKKDKISIKDTFYNLGGDSIKSILLVSRLKQKGYLLKIDDILKFPRIEELAKLMQTDDQIVNQNRVFGQVILTPIQSRLLEEPFIKDIHQANQSVLLKTTKKIDHSNLKQCIDFLINHHDALRMMFKHKNLKWEQYNQNTKDTHYNLNFYDFEHVENPLIEISEIEKNLQQYFRIDEDSLVRIAHFSMKKEDRVLLMIHSLVIDQRSWEILLEDLEILYNQVSESKPMVLSLKTDSYQKWAQYLKDYSLRKNSHKEALYWEKLEEEKIVAIPTKKIDTIKVDYTKQIVNFNLNESLTNQLQNKVHDIYNTNIHEVLLTGLALAIKDTYSLEKSIVELNNHPREEVYEEINVSRTIGDFTSIYPIVLNISDTKNPKEALIRVKDDVRRVSDNGIIYGLMKYMEKKLVNNIEPSVCFKFIEDFNNNNDKIDTSIFQLESESIGHISDRQNENRSLIEVLGFIQEEKLNVQISYPIFLYEKETIEELIKNYEFNLTNLIDEVILEKNNCLTSSDLTFNGLSLDELREINDNDNVEDIYRLSPLQQGMYFHWLSDKSSPMYFEQTSYRLAIANLDIDIVEKAFNILIDNHAILRTRFSDDYAGVPLQIVYKSIKSNFTFEKVLDNLTDRKVEDYLSNKKKNDRANGFDLGEASQVSLQIFEIRKGTYEFLWSHHHILMDGWCINILINDFYKIIDALQNKKTLEPQTNIKYATYIKWLEKRDNEESLKYWKDYLNDYKSIATLPFKNNAIANKSHEHSVHRIIIDGELHAKLKEFCTSHWITQNVFLQGVWGYLLSKYNNTKDVVFGSVVSGRPAELEGIQDMVGLCINTIPVRLKYDETTTPIDLLKGHNQQAIESNPHHYMSLSEVQSLSKLGMNLIDHILVFENYYRKELVKSDDNNSTHNEDQFILESMKKFEQNNYDFHILIMPLDSQLVIGFQYNESMFSSEDIEKCAENFYTLIGSFCTSGDQPLSILNNFSSEEEDTLLYKFNNTKVEYPEHKNIVTVFEEQVKKYPENGSIVYQNESITYKEVNEFANVISSYLKEKKGVGIGDIVAIELADRIDLSLMAILGVLKSGGTYVMIDANLPENRINYILDNSKSTSFLSTNDLLKLRNSSQGYSNENTELHYSSSNTAYVIYTSGTTGKPKGVQVAHKSIVNYVNWFTNKHQIDSDDSSIVTSSIAFDLIYTSLYGALLSGGELHVVDEYTRRDPMKMADYIENNHITFLKVTPTYLNLLLTNTSQNSITNSKSLRLILSGGEHQNLEDVKKIIRNSNIKLINHYGPSETTIGVSTFEITKDNLEEYISTPVIGNPINNNSILILDDDLKLQPIGVMGEIYIGGVGLSKGYINQPELTSQKFIENPYHKGEYLYKSGDLGKRLKNGTIALFGREDDQVKVNGYRIEIGEIESQLNSKENILDSVIIVKETHSGIKEIIAYIVSQETSNIVELREYLIDRIPDYMIPSHFVQLERLPMTSNGKVDKKSLPDYNGIGLSSGVDYVAPKNKKEEVLVSLWEKILQQTPIGIKDDFYSLGGNSIKSLMVISRLKQLGYVLSIKDLLNKPRIEDLAELMEASNEEDSQFISTITNWDIGDEIEIAPNQYRFFKSRYNAVYLDHVITNYNEHSFEDEFRVFLSMYPILCVKFNKRKSEVTQKYVSHKEVAVEFTTVRISEIESEEIREGYYSKPFDLIEGPLIRVFIVPDFGVENVMIRLIIHHALVDAYTVDVINEGLKSFFSYKRKMIDRNVSYYNFVNWQKEFLNSKNGFTQRKYWENKLEGLKLNTKNEDVSEDLTFFVSQKFMITDKALIDIQNLASSYNVPISALFLGYYQILLNQVRLSDKKIIGVMVNGREQNIEGLGIENVLGVIDNLLPLPINNIGDKSKKEYIRNTYTDYLESRVQQQIPYEVIREDFQQKHKIDIDQQLAGRFNFQVWENSMLSEINEKVSIKTVKEYWIYGIHADCIQHENAIEFNLYSSKEIFEENKEILKIESIVKMMLSKKNEKDVVMIME